MSPLKKGHFWLIVFKPFRQWAKWLNPLS